MSLQQLVPILLLLTAACGRPEFGSANEGGAVVDTDVDRASANGDRGQNDSVVDADGSGDGIASPDEFPPLDNSGEAVSPDFAFEAYREVASSGRSAVIAPHGLARSLLIAHASAAPELASTIAAVIGPYLGQDIYSRFNSSDLGLDSRQTDGAFQMLASVWVNQDVAVESEFVDVLAMYLGLQLRLIDFSGSPEDARVQINNWYGTQTEGRISEVLGARTVDADTRFLVTDATWFAAGWGFGGFDPARTTYATFTGSESNVQLQMMATDATLLYFDGQEDLEAVVLPFDNGFSLIAVLPADLDAFDAALEPGLLDRLIDEAQPQPVALQFPRIDVSDRVPLSSVADAIGLGAMFEPGAEYQGFADGTRLDDAYQRTRISFDEAGIDATTAGMDPDNEGGAPSGPEAVAVSFNRPFFFAVRDSETGRYLFLGRVAQP